LTRKSAPMIPAPETSSRAEMSVPARRKKNGVRNAKAIVPDSVHDHPILHEHPGDDKASEIGREDCLTTRRSRQPAETEQDDKEHLHSGSLTRCPTRADHQSHRSWEEETGRCL